MFAGLSWGGRFSAIHDSTTSRRDSRSACESVSAPGDVEQVERVETETPLVERILWLPLKRLLFNRPDFSARAELGNKEATYRRKKVY
jgi:hypothetical protein